MNARKTHLDGLASVILLACCVFWGFQQVLVKVTLDEVSPVVQSPFGMHLIQVQERREKDVSADRQRSVARQAIRERKLDEAYQDWLRQLRDRTYVENRLEEK